MNVGDGAPATIVGRYALFDEIASGGMATVHYGRLLGPAGFSRTVAIKRLHPHLARDAEFAGMFLDEARVAARVRHPNVVPTLDIVNEGGELFLVMEYVQGESLARLLRAARKLEVPMPPSVAAAIVVGVLHGLHAAHEAKNEKGEPLGIVHRDVSPQNVLVGLDGIPRLVDFGVAKAIGRVQTTRDGQLKGKIAYMAPEQIRGTSLSRLVDVYAAAIVFWEMLTGQRLFGGENDVTVLERALHHTPEPPSRLASEVPAALDAVVLRALSHDPTKRYQTAREMVRAIENAVPVASVSRVGEWVESIAGEAIAERAAKVAEIESHSQIRALVVPPPSSGQPGIIDPVVDDASAEIPIRPRKRARRTRIGLVAASVAACAALVAVAFAIRAHRSSAPVSSSAVSATATAAAPEPTPSAAPKAPPEASIAAAPSVSAAPKPVTTHAAPRSNIVREFPTTRHGGKPGCNPPYTIDSNGVKQYKVECL